MHERRIPEWLRHAPAPSVRGFAVLAGTEAIARGILVSVFPLVMYQVLKDAAFVSAVYFAIGRQRQRPRRTQGFARDGSRSLR